MDEVVAAVNAGKYSSAIRALAARASSGHALDKRDGASIVAALTALSKRKDAASTADAPDAYAVECGCIATAYLSMGTTPALAVERLHAQLLAGAAKGGQVAVALRLSALMCFALLMHAKLAIPHELQAIVTHCAQGTLGDTTTVSPSWILAWLPLPASGHTSELARLCLTMIHAVCSIIAKDAECAPSEQWDICSKWLAKGGHWAASMIKAARNALAAASKSAPEAAVSTTLKHAADALAVVQQYQNAVHDVFMLSAQSWESAGADSASVLRALVCRCAGLHWLVITYNSRPARDDVASWSTSSPAAECRWPDQAALLRYVCGSARSSVAHAVGKLSSSAADFSVGSDSVQTALSSIQSMSLDLHASLRKCPGLIQMDEGIMLAYHAWSRLLVDLCSQTESDDEGDSVNKSSIATFQACAELSHDPTWQTTTRIYLSAAHMHAASYSLLRVADASRAIEHRILCKQSADTVIVKAESECADVVNTAANHAKTSFTLLSKVDGDALVQAHADIQQLYASVVTLSLQIHDHLVSEMPMLAGGIVRTSAEALGERRSSTLSTPALVGRAAPRVPLAEVAATPVGAHDALAGKAVKASRAPRIPPRHAVMATPTADGHEDDVGSGLSENDIERSEPVPPRTLARPPRPSAGSKSSAHATPAHVQASNISVSEGALAGPGAPARGGSRHEHSAVAGADDAVTRTWLPTFGFDWWLLLEQAFSILGKQLDTAVARAGKTGADVGDLANLRADAWRCCTELRILRMHAAGVDTSSSSTSVPSLAKYMARLILMKVVPSREGLPLPPSASVSLLHNEDAARHFQKAASYAELCAEACRHQPSVETATILLRCQQLLFNCALPYTSEDDAAPAQSPAFWRAEPAVVLLETVCKVWEQVQKSWSSLPRAGDDLWGSLSKVAQLHQRKLLLCRCLANKALATRELSPRYWEMLVGILLEVPSDTELGAMPTAEMHAAAPTEACPIASIVRKARLHRIIRDILSDAEAATWATAVQNALRTARATSRPAAHSTLATFCECVADIMHDCREQDDTAEAGAGRTRRWVGMYEACSTLIDVVLQEVTELAAADPGARYAACGIIAGSMLRTLQPVAASLFQADAIAEGQINALTAGTGLDRLRRAHLALVQAAAAAAEVTNAEDCIEFALQIVQTFTALQARFHRTGVVCWTDHTLCKLVQELVARAGTTDTTRAQHAYSVLAELRCWAGIIGAPALQEAIYERLLRVSAQPRTSDPILFCQAFDRHLSVQCGATLTVPEQSPFCLPKRWWHGLLAGVFSPQSGETLRHCVEIAVRHKDRTSTIDTGILALISGYALIGQRHKNASASCSAIQVAAELFTAAAALFGEVSTTTLRTAAASVAVGGDEPLPIWTLLQLQAWALTALAHTHAMRGDVGRARHASNKLASACDAHGVLDFSRYSSAPIWCSQLLASLNSNEKIEGANDAYDCDTVLLRALSEEEAGCVGSTPCAPGDILLAEAASSRAYALGNLLIRDDAAEAVIRSNEDRLRQCATKITCSCCACSALRSEALALIGDYSAAACLAHVVACIDRRKVELSACSHQLRRFGRPWCRTQHLALVRAAITIILAVNRGAAVDDADASWAAQVLHDAIEHNPMSLLTVARLRTAYRALAVYLVTGRATTRGLPIADDSIIHQLAIGSVGMGIAYRWMSTVVRKCIDMRKDAFEVVLRLLELAVNPMLLRADAQPADAEVALVTDVFSGVILAAATVAARGADRFRVHCFPIARLRNIAHRMCDILVESAKSLGNPISAGGGDGEVRTTTEVDGETELASRLAAVTIDAPTEARKPSRRRTTTSTKSSTTTAPSQQRIDNAASSALSMSRADKERWWENRFALDERMKQLCDDLECETIGKVIIEWLVGDLSSASPITSGDKPASIASAHEAAPSTGAPPQSSLDISRMTVAELRVELSNAGLSTKGVKAVLAERLQEHLATSGTPASRAAVSAPPTSDDDMATSQDVPGYKTVQSVLLLLDEHSHAFPWELMPSLHAARASGAYPQLLRSCSSATPGDQLQACRPRGTIAYMVNPAGDLPRTEKHLRPVFEEVAATTFAGRCVGRAGAPSPTSEQYIEILQSASSAFFYCGHGGGEAFVSRHALPSRATLSCACVLMGCSSARLTPSHDWMMECDGMLLAYLLAGAPVAIGNAWDVTDKDIDKYTEALIREWSTGGGPTSHGSLLVAARSARAACKLAYMVGAAPVAYVGIGGGGPTPAALSPA